MRTALLLSLVVACKREPPPPPPAPPPPSPPEVEDAPKEPTTERVSYDCGFVIVDPAECARTAAWVADLDALGRLFIEPSERPPSADDCKRAKQALAQVNPKGLTMEERVVAQNGALRLVGPRTCPDDVSILAATAVKRLALPADQVSLSPWPDLDGWIGPDLVDRHGRATPLFHETMEFFTRSFRPVRSDSSLAIFSQLLFVDTEWKVHVTPVVGRIEAREDTGRDAVACLGKLDATRLRCKTGRVQPVAYQDLPTTTFLRKLDGGVDCNRCHASEDTLSNLADATPEIVRERQRRFLVEAEEGLSSVKAKIR